MNEVPEAFTDMLAAWNETDPEKIRAHIDSCLAETITFADPTNVTNGRDAFEQMVREFRKNFPAGRCVRTSGIDWHHNRYRYTWSVFNGEELVVSGLDVVELDGHGMVVRVDGFFGPFPPLEG